MQRQYILINVNHAYHRVIETQWVYINHTWYMLLKEKIRSIEFMGASKVDQNSVLKTKLQIFLYMLLWYWQMLNALSEKQ